MFQEYSDKGLFTFYWEQTHEKIQDGEEEIMEDKNKRKKREEIEDKERKKRQYRTQKHSTHLQRHFSDMNFLSDKENKNVLIPHTVTLAPSLIHINHKLNQMYERKKQRRQVQDVRGEQTKTEEGVSQRQKQAKTQEVFECHKKTLIISQNHLLAKVSSSNTLRPAKIRKAAHRLATVNHSPCSPENIACLTPHDESSSQSCRFPVLFGYKGSHKKTKKLKENYVLEKLWLSGQESQQNSVVNIGTVSVDNYKPRWQKRKADFIALLSTNSQQ